jgi:hypothetical protein
MIFRGNGIAGHQIRYRFKAKETQKKVQSTASMREANFDSIHNPLYSGPLSAAHTASRSKETICLENSVEPGFLSVTDTIVEALREGKQA